MVTFLFVRRSVVGMVKSTPLSTRQARLGLGQPANHPTTMKTCSSTTRHHRKTARILVSSVAAFCAVSLAADPANAASISISFGNGSQNGNGSGPGENSSFWNNLNCTPWDGGGQPYGSSYEGYGPFSSNTPTAVGIVNSANVTLATPITFQSYDAGQAAAEDNYGAWGGWGQTGTGASIGLGTVAYNMQYALFSTSGNSQPGNTNCTLTFANIPYASYNVYVGGQNLYQGAVYGSGTQINGAASFLTQTGSTFQVVAQWGHPYDGLGGKISYIQFVEVSPTAYWTGATDNLWSVANNFATDQSGTPSLTGALDATKDVVFNATAAANFANTTLGANQSIKTLTINSPAAVGIGGAQTLTITPGAPTAGINVATGAPGAVTHTVSANVALGAGQTWTVADADRTLIVSGNVSGNFPLTKAGDGVLNLDGAQAYDSLTAAAGTTNVNGALGTVPANGTAAVAVAAGAKLKFGTVSQTLGSLTVGAGGTVVFTSGAATGAFGGGGGKGAGLGGSVAVPEPGTTALFLASGLLLLRRCRAGGRLP